MRFILNYIHTNSIINKRKDNLRKIITNYQEYLPIIHIQKKSSSCFV